MVPQILFTSSLFVTCSAVHVADITPHGLEVDAIKTAMFGMAKKVSKSGIDSATAMAVQGFLKTINDDLLVCITSDLNSSQVLLNQARDNVHKCDEDRHAWFGASLGYLDGNVSSASNTHNECRVQENVTFTNLTNHCDTLESRVCEWEICDPPVGGFANGDSDAVNEYMCCLDTFFDVHRDHYYTERTNCIDATTLHHAQTAICDGNQQTLEDTYCDREEDIQSRCATYDGCRCAAEAAFESAKSDVEAMEAIFQTQFVALKHLVCYGEQILANATDLTGCDIHGEDCEADYNDCPEVDYPTLDPFIDCTEPSANFPCEDAWVSGYYGHLDGTCTPVQECSPCTDPDVTGRVWGANGGARHSDYASCP